MSKEEKKLEILRKKLEKQGVFEEAKAILKSFYKKSK